VPSATVNPRAPGVQLVRLILFTWHCTQEHECWKQLVLAPAFFATGLSWQCSWQNVCIVTVVFVCSFRKVRPTECTGGLTGL